MAIPESPTRSPSPSSTVSSEPSSPASTRTATDEKTSRVADNIFVRHTYGRVVSLAKIPIYSIFTVLQLAKTVVKGLLDLFTLGTFSTKFLYSQNEQPKDGPSDSIKKIYGFYKDVIITCRLFEHVSHSIIGLFTAPKIDYFGPLEALQYSGKNVFYGSYHKASYSELTGGIKILSAENTETANT